MNSISRNATVALAPPIALALQSNFGSVERWIDAVTELIDAHASAGGEVRLDFDPQTGLLRNHWAPHGDAPGDPRVNLLAIALPAPSAGFLAYLDWARAYQRYQDAVHAASERFAAHGTSGALLLDVRRAGVFEAATTMLPGAAWRDPATVAAWAGALPTDSPVLVYCVYGHEVGRVTALRLQALGVNARFLVGGIDAWQSAGRATTSKGAPS
jgi:Fe-Mn family superoxide dismutase